MKNKKGFTLIELLAVIVILAVIMIIAVPKILDVIESSKKSSFENSYKLLTSAIKTQIASSNIVENNFEKEENDCYVFDFTNNNNNVKSLKVKNKEIFTGLITYCEKAITKVVYTNLSDGTYTINDGVITKNDGNEELKKDIIIYKDGTLYYGESLIAIREYTYPINYDFTSYNYIKLQKNLSYPNYNADIEFGTSSSINFNRKYVVLKTNIKTYKSEDSSFGYCLKLVRSTESYNFTDGTNFYYVGVIPDEMKEEGILRLYYWVTNGYQVVDTEEVRISEIILTNNLPTDMTEY